jgi:transposase
MWTVENRARYDRSRLRYPSDLTDEEWALVKPEIPRAKRGGNKRTVDVREVVVLSRMMWKFGLAISPREAGYRVRRPGQCIEE